MSTESPKRTLLAHFAAIAKAVGHAHRLELLELLGQRERGVDALARLADLSVANASQHLQHLRRAGLVTSRQEGKNVFYSLSDDGVIQLLAALRQIGEKHVAEIEKVISGYFHDRDSMEPVSPRDLLRRMKEGLVTVLDVRPADEFGAGHIRGAVNIPLKDLSRRLRELPRGQEVVAYCRGPYCVLSFEAVAALRRRGFTARRLEDGYPEWRAAGRPVDGPAREK